ncbi:hypothetical protein D3C80_1932080 [compost metagenome]
MKAGTEPKPKIGTATARTATGGKVWPILAMARDSGRNSRPLGRVVKMPSVTAMIVAASVAIPTSARWLIVSAKSEFCV